MLFYFLEKYFLFLTAMIVFSVIMYLLDITEPASMTFIYPEMDTLFNCFSETFFERLKSVHRIMESFDFLKNTFVYDSLRLFVIRILFLVYGHFGVLSQILFAGFCLGYVFISMFRSSMVSFKSAFNLVSVFTTMLRYLTIFLMFQSFCDLIYLTCVMLLLSVFLMGTRLAVIVLVG